MITDDFDYYALELRTLSALKYEWPSRVHHATLYPLLEFKFRHRMKPRKRRACAARVRNRKAHAQAKAARREGARWKSIFRYMGVAVHEALAAAAEALNDALAREPFMSRVLGFEARDAFVDECISYPG